jgi:hypothetical protein
MYIRSTGLGKTLLKADIAKIEATNVIPSTLEASQGSNEPMRLLMTMEIREPVHWTVRAFVEPPDLRHMLMILLANPKILFHAVQFLFTKGLSSKQKSNEK